MKHNYIIKTILALLLMVAAGGSVWAQTFSITASYSSSDHRTTFSITRSGSHMPAQRVYYRTVNLSAYAGQHYTATSGYIDFPATNSSSQERLVQVTEGTPASDAYAYRYQSGSSRFYRFEVLDVNGFLLADYNRGITTGTSINANNAFGEKDLTINSGTITVTDGGYAQAYHSVTVSDYYSAAAPKDYLVTAGAQLRTTVTFNARESDDGYQYIQIYANTSADNDHIDVGADDGDPGSYNYARYVAGFTIDGNVSSTYYPYTFPVTAYGHNCGYHAHPWSGNFNGNLEQQYFKSNCRATDGRLIVPTDLSSLYVRLDASGHLGDTWYCQNLKAHIQAVDATKPTLYGNSTSGITVSAGPHVKGNTFYISVPFSEIVHITGSPKGINTTWGYVYYESGDYSNVITFKGTINASAGTLLKITDIYGCVFSDLAGNGDSFTAATSFDKTFTGVTCTEGYTLADYNTAFTGLDGDYVVSDGTVVPQPVPTTVYFYKGKKETANRVPLSRNTHYTLSWSNNSVAGNGTVTATGAGIYNGSASTTFPIRWSTYTVRFHENGSIAIPATGTMEDQAFQYGVAQGLSANAFSREGFTFIGWNTQPDGSGTPYSNGQSVIGLTTEDGAVIDLYAQWAVIPWGGSGDDADDPYIILYASQLDSLAATVNSGTTYQYKFFKLGADITYGTTGLGANESNYTAIGISSHEFYGTFDGDGKTVSGIRIYRPNYGYQGLFGSVCIPTVKNIILANSIIVGKDHVGGIAGYKLYGTVTNCRVENDVTIGVENDLNYYHGGIVGTITSGTVSGCVSTASVNGNNYCGGIAGNCSSSTIKDCLFTGTITGGYRCGSITGYNSSNTFINNYYTSDGLGGVNDSDCDGARRARIFTLDEHVALNGDETEYDVSGLTAIGTGNYAIRYNSILYSAATQNLTFSHISHSGVPSTGYVWDGFSATAGTLTGNSLTMPAAAVTVSATTRDVWGVTNTPNAADGSEDYPYLISDTTGLNLLARNVNGTHGYTANDFNGKFFRLANNITYSHTTSWDNSNSTENNYTAIGNVSYPFCGTFDGAGNTISGIRIYKSGTDNEDSYQGLFGIVSNGFIKNLNLTDTRITGFQGVGGIAGILASNTTATNIENCCVTGSVTIYAINNNSFYHGGIVGQVNGAGISGSSSAATISIADGHTSCVYYGGIVGIFMGNMQDCLAIGVNVSGSNHVAAVVGAKAVGSTCTANYYRGCTVNGTVGATNVGTGNSGDIRGIRSLHTLALGDGISATGSETRVIGNTTYYASASTITLSYTGTIPTGYSQPGFTYNDGSDHTVEGNSFTMPGADVSVSTMSLAPIDYNISYDLAGGSLPQGQSNPATYNVESADIILVNPVRLGYVFAGWTGDGLDAATTTVTLGHGSTGERSYTATWTDVWGMGDGANGSSEHPYVISTPAGLDLLAQMVNGIDGHTHNSFSSNYFKLNNDIDYSTKPLDANGENYTAIGCYYRNSSYDFRGTFDGCGHTVSGIRIHKGGTEWNGDRYQGLFGMTDGTVKNVTLTDADITGWKSVGGIVGELDDGGTVENCHVTGSVVLHAVQNGANDFGGIVGDANSSSSYTSTITGCSSAATLAVADGVTDCRYFGGIVGYLNGKLQNCLVLGATLPDLHNDDDDVSGAIAGYYDNDYTLIHNYYRGVTLGGETTGIGIGFDYDHNGDARHDIASRDGAVAGYTVTVGEHITATPAAGLTFNNSDYYAVGTTVTLSAEGYTLGNEGYTVKDAQNNDVALTDGNSFVMPESDVTVSATLTVTPWSGSGTGDDPYIIIYRSQLDLLASNVNSGNMYANTFFRLGADISYPHTTAWDDASSTENNYTAIDYFRGTFDGDGHNVSGIRIYTESNNAQGLFGHVSGGTIKNLTLTDARITGEEYVGGIAGYIDINADEGGIIENCHVTGSVAIHAIADYARYHGGIVGNANGGIVIGCSSAATLTMANDIHNCVYYGGIVGKMNGQLQDCLVVGANVSGSEDVGAITGFADITSSILSHNYYNNCTVNGTANASNVGCGEYYDDHQYHNGDIADNDGAMPCYKLTLPTVLTTSGNTVINYQGSRYVAAGQTVALEPVYDDYTIGSLTYNDGSDHNIVGNNFVMPAHDVTVSVTWVDLPDWGGSGTLDDPWVITTCAELDALAIRVNGGNDYYEKWFKLGADISYPHTTAWDDTTGTENNYTAIGGYFNGSNRRFQGTFDGCGHTISGIRIYKGGDDNGDSHQGLFGLTKYGYIHNVTLTNARITGYRYVGGIIGDDDDWSEAVNCHATATVAIHAVANDCRNHGGIAGYLDGDCEYCTSAATISVAQGVTGCNYFGGIAGHTYSMRGCLALGVTISGAAEESGAIVGSWSDNLVDNYYRECRYGEATENIGTGEGDVESSWGALPAEEVSVTIPGYGEGYGGWRFISSPMYYTMTPRQVQNLVFPSTGSGQAPSTGSGQGNENYDFYRFNQEAAGAEWQNYKSHSGSVGGRSSLKVDFLIQQGLGYLYASKETVTLTFFGSPYTYDNYSTGLDLRYTEGNPLAGWNLVGNPYAVPAYADHPYYRMNAEGNGLEACATSEAIPVCTGVMVQIATDREQVHFSRTAPSSKGASLNLKVSNAEGKQIDNAVITFGGEHSLEKNETLNSQFSTLNSKTSLSIPQGGKRYAVAAVSDSVKAVEVSLEAPVGEYTLGVMGLMGLMGEMGYGYCHLIDRVAGEEVDLLKDSSYRFTVTTGSTGGTNRFLLKFAPSNSQFSTLSSQFAHWEGDHLVVTCSGLLSVYDALGREVLRENVSTYHHINVSTFPQAGVYVLRLNGRCQKIVVR